ncbi:MAG TPA: autoinducer binding domain-containing protein [Burkholderiaceae bacterium]|jgi:DNA-binding CsgD family transcriptional regulator|nr:autoinducer binding domain-containing protein [Burkholderiaceae bacterium]
MEPWQEDHLNALLHIESEHELFDEVASLAKKMGFEYCAYGIQMPVPVSRPMVVAFNNYSLARQECCEQPSYFGAEATAQQGMKGAFCAPWLEEAFEPAQQLWKEAHVHGLRFGWAQSSRDPSGAVGVLILGHGAEHLAENELRVDKAKMAWLAQYTHACMAKLLIPKYVPESTVLMTMREKEVLRWTAEGKTAYEIGQILSVSERTVNFHINNVVVKLRASNKTQAAVKAVALGLLA